MQKPIALLAVAALLGAAACSKPAPAADLRADLDAANASSLELAPRSAGTQIVSDLEQTPRATPAPAAQRAPAPRPAPQRAPQAAPRREPAPQAVAQAPDPAPEVIAPAPAPEPQPEIIPTPRPMPAPQSAPARRGGYSSVSDVIRRAPFPITP